MPTTTIVNDGSIFLLLGIWCALPPLGESLTHPLSPTPTPTITPIPTLTLTRTRDSETIVADYSKNLRGS